jgi:8-oxo-dGTP diphosphatase
MGASEQGAGMTENRWLTIPRTLCFIVNGGNILLMKRAAHKKIFPNRYNGVGGHIERHEDPLSSARREILEETGLKITGLHLRAVYNIDTDASNGILLFVFVGHTNQYNTTSNNEGSLHWIPIGDVLKYDLVDDLPYILPRILPVTGEQPPFFVHVSYDATDHIVMRFAE